VTRSFLPILLCAFSLVCAAQTGKIEIIGAATDTGISDSLKKALDAKGYRITIDDGSVCEIWLRAAIPTQIKKESDGVLYPQLAESTLLGVISFSKDTTDYKGDPVKAGVYTMRYALLPNDGNHLGVAPSRDFVLLVPVASDSDPAASFKIDELVRLSTKATGTPHPAPFSLVSAEASSNAGITKDSEDHWVFSTNAKSASGEALPLALIVKGVAQQ